MNDQLTELWARYESTAAMLLPPLEPDDGDTEASLVDVERALGISLPWLLRTFYIHTANRKDINQSMNRIVPPNRLTVDDGSLCFYEENQAVCYWGIAVDDLALDDPPVHRGTPQWRGNKVEKWDWFVENSRLSDFLMMMLIWQCSWGGMAYYANTTVDGAWANRMYEDVTGWDRLVDPGASGLRALWRDGQLLTFGGRGDIKLNACGKTREDLDAIALYFGVEWKRVRGG